LASGGNEKMNKKPMCYLEYKNRFFKGESFDDIVITFSDLGVKNKFLKDLCEFSNLKVQKDLPLSTQKKSIFGQVLKTLETNLSEDEKTLLKRPVDKDTSIIDMQLNQFNECIALSEYWNTDGYWGGSLVVLKKDIPTFNREGFIRSLLHQVNYSPDKTYTTSEKDEFFFINYNFYVST
jgi:hypothetical protein